MSQRKSGGISESTIARMAGNIMAGVAPSIDRDKYDIGHEVRWCVCVAREIAREVERTKPAQPEAQP